MLSCEAYNIWYAWGVNHAPICAKSGFLDDSVINLGLDISIHTPHPHAGHLPSHLPSLTSADPCSKTIPSPLVKLRNIWYYRWVQKPLTPCRFWRPCMVSLLPHCDSCKPDPDLESLHIWSSYQYCDHQTLTHNLLILSAISIVLVQKPVWLKGPLLQSFMHNERPNH